MLIRLHTVKWFQVLLCIHNNSIRHQSFVYIHFDKQTVLFQINQFNISRLFALSLNVKRFRLYLKIPENFVRLISWTYSGLCSLVKFQFFTQFPADHFPTQSSLILYSFSASLLYSLILWLMIYYYYHYYYYYLLIRVFQISVRWWSFIGVWVTASLQDSSQYSDCSQ